MFKKGFLTLGLSLALLLTAQITQAKPNQLTVYYTGNNWGYLTPCPT